ARNHASAACDQRAPLPPAAPRKRVDPPIRCAVRQLLALSRAKRRLTAKTTIDRRAPAYAQEVSKSFGPASAKTRRNQSTAKLAKHAKSFRHGRSLVTKR